MACTMECTIVVPDLCGKFQNALPSKEPDKTNYQKSILNISSLKVSNNDTIDLGVEKIRECLLNKYPWLFLDRVTDLEP